jgi:endoglucanase
VTFIDENGYLYFNQIGGIDPAVLPGSLVTVHSRQGPLTGVLGHKPVHLTPPTERGKAVELSKLWIDLGMKDGKEVKEIVEIGDPVTYQLGVTRMGEHRISSPGCDDKVGAFVVMEALRLVAQAKKKNLPVALFAVSTVQEEIGLRGAKTSCFGIDPLVGIAVDVTHASDNPGADAKTVGSVKLGDGPTIARGANFNKSLVEHMITSAKKGKIPYQPHCAPGATGTDANSIQISRAGVATALVGIPNRYMHTQVEIVDLRDLSSSAQLLADTVLSMTQRMDFIPA